MSIENKQSQLEITRPESSPDESNAENLKNKEETHEKEQSVSEVVMQYQEAQYAILQEQKSQQEEEFKSHDQNVEGFRDRITGLQEQKDELAGIYDEEILADFDNVVAEVISQKREKEEQRLDVYNQLGERLDEQENFSNNLDKLRKQYEARSAELKTLDHELEEKINTLNEHIQTFTEHTKNIREKIEKSQEGLEKIQGLAGEATNEAEQVKWDTLIKNINESIKEKQENFNANMAELTKMEEESQSKKETKEKVSQQLELYNKHTEDLKQRSSEIKTVVEKERADRAEKEVSTEDQALDYMIHGISSEEESLDNILYFLDQNFAAHGISLNESTAELAGRTLDAQEKFAELGRIIREKGPEKADVENALQDTVDHIGTVEAQKVQETFIEVLYNEHVNVTSEQEEDKDVDGISTELNSDTVNPKGNTRDVESVQETAYNTEDQRSEEQAQQNETAPGQEEGNLETRYGEQVKKMISILGEDWKSRTDMKVVKAEKGEDGKKKSETVPLPQDLKEKIDYVLNVQKKEAQNTKQMAFERPLKPSLTQEEITQADAILKEAKDGEIVFGGEPYTLPGSLDEDRKFVLDLKKNGAGAHASNSEYKHHQNLQNQEGAPQARHNTGEPSKEGQSQSRRNGELEANDQSVSTQKKDSGNENKDETRKDQENQEDQVDQVEKMKVLLGENWESRSFMNIKGQDGYKEHATYFLPPDPDERIKYVLKTHKNLVEKVLSERPSDSSLTQNEIARADKILEKAKKGIVRVNDQPYLLPSDRDDQRWFVLALRRKNQEK